MDETSRRYGKDGVPYQKFVIVFGNKGKLIKLINVNVCAFSKFF